MTKGKLLVATPPLNDPNFDRSVVYVLEHTLDDGALGVIINRATAESEIDGLEAWFELLSSPGLVFEGGPCEPNALIGIARSSSATRNTSDPNESFEQGWAPIMNDLGTVDLASPPHDVTPTIERLRIFRGYAGWSPGQLEAELSESAWMVLPTEADDLFTDDPSGLWRRVVRRQGGRFEWIANVPDDLSVN